jgi:hypothetical protein
MEIRIINNEDFLQLVNLTAEMYKSIDITINNVGSTATLVNDVLNKPNFCAIGLYEENALQGFVTGYEWSKNVFYFSGIYVTIKNNEWTKKLIEFCFTFVKDKGYSAWQVDATNGNISSIMEKYGATAKYTRYYKEME